MTEYRRVLLLAYRGIAKVISGLGIGRRYPFGAIQKFIRTSIFSNLTSVQGHRMILDSRDSLNLLPHGVHEPLVTELVRREVRSGDVVLDIGAHIGYYTLILAGLVGENGKVFAFEPEPANFDLLKKNIRMNGYANVVAEQKAVSNKTGHVRLYMAANNTIDHRIYDPDEGRASVQIEAVRLDDYFVGYQGPIDLVKMDIQGAEGAAIHGMSNLLKKYRRISIVLEFWPLGLNRFGTAPEGFLQSLIQHGFRVYHVNERTRKTEPVNIHELLQYYAPEQGNYTTLLCVRRE